MLPPGLDEPGNEALLDDDGLEEPAEVLLEREVLELEEGEALGMLGEDGMDGLELDDGVLGVGMEEELLELVVSQALSSTHSALARVAACSALRVLIVTVCSSIVSVMYEYTSGFQLNRLLAACHPRICR